MPRDCPVCRHSMETLKEHLRVRREEGYLLDSSSGREDVLALGLAGEAAFLLRLLGRQILAPLWSRTLGDWRQRRLRRVLERFPRSLICPECGHLVRCR